jgi:hypothetical protein
VIYKHGECGVHGSLGEVPPKTNTNLTLILYNLQHVSSFKSHLLAEYKAVYIIQCHKMDKISCTYSYKSNTLTNKSAARHIGAAHLPLQSDSQHLTTPFTLKYTIILSSNYLTTISAGTAA